MLEAHSGAGEIIHRWWMVTDAEWVCKGGRTWLGLCTWSLTFEPALESGTTLPVYRGNERLTNDPRSVPQWPRAGMRRQPPHSVFSCTSQLHHSLQKTRMRHLEVHWLPTQGILKWAGTRVKSPRPVRQENHGVLLWDPWHGRWRMPRWRLALAVGQCPTERREKHVEAIWC